MELAVQQMRVGAAASPATNSEVERLFGRVDNATLAFVGTKVRLVADLRALCETEGVATMGVDGKALAASVLQKTLRALYVERYKDQPDMIGSPPSAKPLLDEIKRRSAARTAEPAHGGRRRRATTVRAQASRSAQRPRGPQRVTRDEVAAARRTAADQRLNSMIEASSDEESETESLARIANGQDGDFEDASPSPPPRRSTRSNGCAA